MQDVAALAGGFIVRVLRLCSCAICCCCRRRCCCRCTFVQTHMCAARTLCDFCAGGAGGAAGIAQLERALRPVERYAVRWVEADVPQPDAEQLAAQVRAAFRGLVRKRVCRLRAEARQAVYGWPRGAWLCWRLPSRGAVHDAPYLLRHL